MLGDQSFKSSLFDAVIANPAVGVALLNPAGLFLFCNSTLEKIVGYESGELVGKSFLEITHPADLQRSKEKWATLDKSVFVKRFLSKKGEPIWVSITITLLDDRGPNFPRTMSLIQDVTKEYTAAQKQQESDLIFRQLAENISSVFWMTDPEKQKMLYVSPAYEVIWGLRREDIYADPLLFTASIHPEDRQKVFNALPLQIEGKFNIEYRITRPDGSVRMIRDRAFPIANESGEIYRICGIALDITEIKEHERIMADQQMQIAASAKFSSLGEMAAGIAHEINSPLAALQLNIDMLRETVEPAEFERAAAQKMLGSMDSTVKRISKIVRSLRRLGRDAKGDPFEKTAVKSVVEDMVELCRERFKGHSISLEVAEIPAAVTIDCRPVEISQILLNLLNNAHDAVEQTLKPWIRVEFAERDNEVEVAVVDSGPAIPPEIRQELFVPFFTTKEAGKGTGIGLPLCVSIAQAHQGRLFFDKLAANTRFVLILPKLRKLAP